MKKKNRIQPTAETGKDTPGEEKEKRGGGGGKRWNCSIPVISIYLSPINVKPSGQTRPRLSLSGPMKGRVTLWKEKPIVR